MGLVRDPNAASLARATRGSAIRKARRSRSRLRESHVKAQLWGAARENDLHQLDSAFLEGRFGEGIALGANDGTQRSDSDLEALARFLLGVGDQTFSVRGRQFRRGRHSIGRCANVFPSAAIRG